MYCSGSRLEYNTITSASGAFGIGICLKDASDTYISDNLIMYNGRGFYTDQSPNKPGTINRIRRNKVYYNTIGIQLHGTILPTIYEDNVFLGNIDTIVNDTLGSSYGAYATKVVVIVSVSTFLSSSVSTKLWLVPVLPAGL